MTTTVQVTLPRAAVLNSNQRPSRYKKAAMASVIRTRFRIAAQTGQRLITPVHCYAMLGFSDPDRIRDANNWHDTTKPAIDGCVDAGLLAKDDHRHLLGPDHRIDPEPCAKGFVRISLVFEEVGRDG